MKYCIFCGTQKVLRPTGFYDGNTGERGMSLQCPDPCHEGKHEWESKGLGLAWWTTCKRCGIRQ